MPTPNASCSPLCHTGPKRVLATWLIAALLLVGAWGEGRAASPSGAAEAVAPAVAQARREALTRASAAVVGIEVTAVDEARSIGTLGRNRRGSGVVIADDGLVLTIGYLILEADHTDLVLDDGRRIPARVVAYDQPTGFGLVQSLAPLSPPAVPLGNSSAVATGEPLLVVVGGQASDLGVARMVSRRAFSGYWEYHIEDALFTAPARDDHSGAGLFNVEGELVGIGSLRVAQAAGTSAAPIAGNMFVPVSLLQPILGDLRRAGASSRGRPWLGVNCVEYEGEVRVIRTTADGPAETAGILPGDAILAVDGTAIADLGSFYKALWADPRPDREVTVDLRRGARPLRLAVRAVDRLSTLRRPAGV